MKELIYSLILLVDVAAIFISAVVYDSTENTTGLLIAAGVLFISLVILVIMHIREEKA